MGLILNDLKNACELEHVCDYVNNRTTSSMNYISTENMLPNKGGISESTIIPPGTTTEYKIGDILISNIRPYFQKIWCADRCGGCSADVLCIRAKENTDSKYSIVGNHNQTLLTNFALRLCQIDNCGGGLSGLRLLRQGASIRSATLGLDPDGGHIVVVSRFHQQVASLQILVDAKGLGCLAVHLHSRRHVHTITQDVLIH